MLFYMKLQNKYPVYKSEYKALERVRVLDKRELFLGRKTISDVVNGNASSWINIFDLISCQIQPELRQPGNLEFSIDV